MWTWTDADPLLLAVTIVVALAVASRAIITSRTPQGAIGWIVMIASVPMLGVPLYLVFGQSNPRRAVPSRGTAEAEPGVRAASARAARGDIPDRLDVFETMSGHDATRGNRVDLLIDGEATYAALFHAIEEARHYLLVQFYIVREDSSGQRLKAALCEKARAGVRVLLLHDSFHGLGFSRRWLRELQAAGVEVRAPRGPRKPLGWFQINYRNHRKVLIADGVVALIGGFNIGDEYLGKDPVHGAWRDTHIRVLGPMITRFQKDFMIDWRLSGSGPGLHLFNDARSDPRDMRGLVLAPAPTNWIETGNLYFCALIQRARHRLWIATPYFVPDTDVLSALKLAAVRGVEVRILVADTPDHWLPWLAAFTYFDEVRYAGAEIWRYKAGFMHQKVVLVDDDLASVGTINLDIRSGLLNFETTAIVEDTGFAREVEAMLEADFARARRMQKDLRERSRTLQVGAHLARLFAPVL